MMCVVGEVLDDLSVYGVKGQFFCLCVVLQGVVLV